MGLEDNAKEPPSIVTIASRLVSRVDIDRRLHDDGIGMCTQKPTTDEGTSDSPIAVTVSDAVPEVAVNASHGTTRHSTRTRTFLPNISNPLRELPRLRSFSTISKHDA